jgi:aryl-phospho-beta-D-glucosidase BglC (GH1 family)
MILETLKVKDNQIIDQQGKAVRLRGTCIGGWMNMENFINGYPGAEHGLRRVMAEVLSPNKAYFFFERLLDYFLAEEDIAFIKKTSSNVVRLPLNYRHFETDLEPFKYLETGFARLNQVVDWCAKYEIYVILDLHAVQGFQNTDWHCDNSSRHTFFWHNRQFQDRFVALWEEFARRYKNNAAIAGYNIMNEPLCNAQFGRFTDRYTADWDNMNAIYRRVVAAIRAIDPNHIIFLEGDYFSDLFDGLEKPLVPNLVYSSHNYNASTSGPGPYPGVIHGEQWDHNRQVEILLTRQGTQFTQKHRVPLWAGEFGAKYNGPKEELLYRLRAMDDQIGVFEENGVHWTSWTYKDLGIMGWVWLHPESEYMQRISRIIDLKYQLDTDYSLSAGITSPFRAKINELGQQMVSAIQDPGFDTTVSRYLAQAALEGFAGGLMQPSFAKCFAGLSEAEIDRVLQSYAFKNCLINEGLMPVIKKHTTNNY